MKSVYSGLSLLSILAFLVISCEEPAKDPAGDDAEASLVTSPNEGFTKAVVRVGIMGDSVSTFGGELVNNDYKWHYPKEGDNVLSVDQTWWWQLIYEKMPYGILDVNNSFAGTKVVRGSYSGLSGTSYEAGFVDRVGEFYHPDVIIIYGGINDCIKNASDADLGEYQWDVPLEEMDLDRFRSAYAYLVKKLQEQYDGVQLILIVGARLGASEDLQYDDSIIEIARHFSLPCVDLTPYWRNEIQAPDWVHPNDVGHAFIAQKVYDTCRDYLK